MLGAGRRDLAEGIAHADNFVRIREVRDGALLGWLEEEGLTQEEGARIQPTYSPELDFTVFASILFAVFLPLKIAGDAVWRGVVRRHPNLALPLALGLTVGVVLVAVGLAISGAILAQPTDGSEARIYRTALVAAFFGTLLPLELAALWALIHGEPRQTQRWRAVAPYLGLVNVGIATFLAMIIVPLLSRILR